MIDDNFGFADIGHNRPPVSLPLAEALRGTLEETQVALTDRRDELLRAEGRMPPIENDEAAGKVGDYIKEITAACKAADGARVALKEPYLAGGRVVDGFFIKGVIDPLLALHTRCQVKLKAFLDSKAEAARQERMRLEREARAAEDTARKQAQERDKAARTEAERTQAAIAAREAEQASVNRIAAEEATRVKPAELSRTRGDFGSVASLRAYWDFEVVDAAALPRAYLMLNEAAIRAHIKARIKDQPPAPIGGLRFFEKTAAAVR